MDRNELKDKIFRAKQQIKPNIDQILNDLSFAEKCQKARDFFKKHGHEAWERFKSLPKDTRRNILIVAIVLSSAVGTPVIISQFQQAKAQKEISNHNKEAKKKTNTSYQITDKASFGTLYQDALPLMSVSMFPTECLVLNPYSDNKTSVQNTIGLGSFWYPKNGDPKSKDWVKASTYFKNTPNHTITAEHALDLVDGWYRFREGGRIYKNLCNLLQGTTLKPNEFAAIASVMYNNEKKGAELCKYVAKHYNDPMKCAQKIISFDAPDGFSGIDKRHLHEAYLYLNLDNYVQNLYNLQIREGINSKDEHYITTSVTQLSEQEVVQGKKAVLSGDPKEIINAQNAIVKYVTKNSVSVRQKIMDNVISPNVQKELLSYGILTFELGKSDLALSPDQIYQQALDHYAKATALEKEGKQSKSQKEYTLALQTFQELTGKGYKGADLYNDIAITYYHLGEYQKCINESKRVLETGEETAYSAANYNAGKAYEQLGNKKRAILNYEAAIAHGADKEICQKAIYRLQNTSQYQTSPKMNLR